MKEMSKYEFFEVIDRTLLLLKDNNEWRERYTSYAEIINQKLGFIKYMRKSFHEWSPLKVYLNTSSVKNASNSICFELRYLGQTVAKLKAKNDNNHKINTKGFETTNLRDFGCDLELSNADWGGKDAANFRSFFNNREGARNMWANKGNEEHRLESLLLTEFSRRKDKVLRYIKPVMIGGVRFPMPTPISASNHKDVKYSGIKGGGIDILTRTGTGGKATRLCINELKDENDKVEPPKDAVKQAVAYATFIRELLRSNAGEDWWKLFGFRGNIPEPLELYAACVMPSEPYNDYSFGNMELNIERDIIKIHYLYFNFNEGNKRITIKPGNTTLPVMD